MATIKSYTSLEQSKVLAEILPLESADMFYFLDPTPAGNIYHLIIQRIDFGVKTREPEYDKGDIPCWSLAALLAILSRYCNRLETELRVDKMYNIFAVSGDYVYRSFDIYPEGVENLVDVYVEVIEKLHENNWI